MRRRASHDKCLFWQCCFAWDVACKSHRYEMKSRRDGSAASLGDDPARLGAMVPMMVSPDQLVGHLLLFGRQAGV